MKIGFILLVAALSLWTDVASGREPARIRSISVDRPDLNLCTGEWYEIARFDHPFQQGVIESRVVYQLLPENKMRVIHQGIDGKTGKKKITRAKGRFMANAGGLQISFFWFFYGGYAILESDPNGEWTVVRGSSERHLWVLARRPKLSTKVIARILSRLEKGGYDIAKLHFVDQRRNIIPAAVKTQISTADISRSPSSTEVFVDTVAIRFPADSSTRE